MEYKEYLQSDQWKKLKQRFFSSKRFKGVCFVCEKPSKVYHLHHKTYKNFGKEKLQNMVALCDICHENVHFENGIKLPLNPTTLNTRVYALRQKPASLRQLQTGSILSAITVAR